MNVTWCNCETVLLCIYILYYIYVAIVAKNNQFVIFFCNKKWKKSNIEKKYRSIYMIYKKGYIKTTA